jgi:peptidoglycan/LPS O-acetylase OafA/YrhL
VSYRSEIDGLRALAVVAVILFHAGFKTFSGGFVGVDVFFVISGYLITSIILSEKREGTFTLMGFYERRARRILPALFTVLLVCVPFAWVWMLPSDMKVFSKSVVAVAVFASNILFWRESGYFEKAAELKPLLHTWSLGVEEQYYVLFPLFLLIAWRFDKHRVIIILAAIALISLLVAQWGTYYMPEATFYLFPTRSWELLIGAMVAYSLFPSGRIEGNTTLSAQLFSLAGFVLVAYAVFGFDSTTPFPGAYALLPTLGAALIIIYATPETLVHKLLSVKPMVGIGLVSYSAYLWHQPLFAFARHGNIGVPNVELFFGLSSCTFVLAYVTWKYVETPFRSRRFLSRRVLFVSLFVVTTSFVGVGVGVYAIDGGIDRYPSEDRELAGFDYEAAGRYVGTRFESKVLEAFDGSPRKKVLLIGDSYAQDLVNALYESELSAGIQLSTYMVRAQCGNLFIKRDMSSYIGEVERPRCRKDGWYNNETLQSLMREADSIWLASSWKLWQVELLPESLQNIRSVTKAEIVVFGRKNFGAINMRDLLAVPSEKRKEVRREMSEESIWVNQRLRTSVPGSDFVDVSTLLCDKVFLCPLFTEEGTLISHDGGHLTRDGAGYVGRKLSGHPVIMKVLGLT